VEDSRWCNDAFTEALLEGCAVYTDDNSDVAVTTDELDL